MKTITIDFDRNNLKEWGNLQAKISSDLVIFLSCGRNFSVKIEEKSEKKTNKQIKAAYKLFQLSLPHFQKWIPNNNWDLEQIKEFSKTHLGYVRDPNGFEISMMIKKSNFNPKNNTEKQKMIKFCKKIKQNISFFDFTKEQFMAFLEEYQSWALASDSKNNKDSWEDVFLTNEEKNEIKF